MTLATLHLTLIQPGRNCYRFYELSVQPGLFQEWSLVRAWGRIGTKGCGKTIWFSSREEAEQFYERKRREKLKRGYLPTLFPLAPYCDLPTPSRPETQPKTPTPAKKPSRTRRGSVDQQELFGQ